MKQKAGAYVYWPNLSSQIEPLVKQCSSCAQPASNSVKNHFQSCPKSTAPWQRRQLDFAGPINGVYYLITVESYSKFPEIQGMSTITSTTIIKVLRPINARFGFPELIVTYNGSRFHF